MITTLIIATLLLLFTIAIKKHKSMVDYRKCLNTQEEKKAIARDPNYIRKRYLIETKDTWDFLDFFMLFFAISGVIFLIGLIIIFI